MNDGTTKPREDEPLNVIMGEDLVHRVGDTHAVGSGIGGRDGGDVECGGGAAGEVGVTGDRAGSIELREGQRPLTGADDAELDVLIWAEDNLHGEVNGLGLGSEVH
jgi:hypothetical protein